MNEVYAVEPVTDLAALGGPDDQNFCDEPSPLNGAPVTRRA
jgi:hypothetical protein